MNPTPARILTRILLAAATTVAALAPALVATEAAAQINSASDRCRAELAVANRRYLQSVLSARVRCENRLIDGLIPPSTDCIDGDGDEKMQKRLRRAQDKLTNTGGACGGVNLQLLGFPGVCTDTTPATPFDTSDFQKCVIDRTDLTVADLLKYYYPPIDDFFRNGKATCLSGTANDAMKSYLRTLRSREGCLLGQDVNLVDPDVNCRAEILPFGPGTGDERVDREVARGYSILLGGIPVACVGFDLTDFDYQDNCPDPTGGTFTIFDLKQCLWNVNQPEVLDALAICFPTDPVCGDGVQQAGEECDEGIAGNSDTQPNSCRTDCTLPVCHDGVTDTQFDEECDDGNTVDGDCCSGECVTDKCGDGVKNCNEECDNFPNNGNGKDQCRANCQDPGCGDNVTDTGEQCDDGNRTDGDGCSGLCFEEFCGDDEIQPGLGEQCDNGVDNSDTEPDACRENCKNPRCGDGVTDTGEVCDDGNTADGDGCSPSCSICGDGIKSPSETCDGDGSVCPAGEGCTSECSCAPACPAYGELVLWAGVGEDCDTNADCPVGTCNGDGKCQTITRLDSGWTGLAHKADINNEVRTRGFLDCPGHGPTCGECNVIGVDPSTRSCRCANDIRVVCDQPFAADANDCGGNTCNCYFGSPFPLSSGGTPACIVNRFAENITGTANVDLGAGQITANLRTAVYLGPSTTDPCPACGGTCSNASSTYCVRDEDCPGGTCNDDPVPDDGERGGVCVAGQNEGLSCDVGARNTSFPAFTSGPNGGGYSLDCLPLTGANVSGAGLVINLRQTTGTVEIASEVSCGGGNAALDCPCRQCSGEPTISCTKDSDCSSQQGTCTVPKSPLGNFRCDDTADCKGVDLGACKTNGRCTLASSVRCTTNAECASADVGDCNPSTCSSNGNSFAAEPAPNQCSDGVCDDIGGGVGACATGPDESFCSGVLKANGGGILSCNSNEDCAPDAVGIDARPCDTVARRPCFLDPIVATGDPDPNAPVGVSTFCVPPTDNPGINLVAGLPGPGRAVNQATAKTFCESDPNKQYQPGVGGCLE